MRHSAQHNRTALLTPAENEQFFELLKAKQLSLCTTIAQIYKTRAPFHSEWKLLANAAVLCLIKDNRKRAYYLKAYASGDEPIWQEELYPHMDYLRQKLYFHTFEASVKRDRTARWRGANDDRFLFEDCIVGLNFADTREADDLYRAVQTQIDAVTRRARPPATRARAASTVRRGRRTLQISGPTNFQHVQHVGFGADAAATRLTSREFIAFFERNGLDVRRIERPRTRRVIDSFMETYGAEMVRLALDVTAAGGDPPKSSTDSPNASTPERSPIRLPPAPPSIPSRAVPLQVTQQRNVSVPSPPPPPPPLRDNRTLTPIAERSVPIEDDGRANLLESIRRGTKLRPAFDRKLSEDAPSTRPQETVNDIRAALQQALSKRSNAFGGDDTSSSSDDRSGTSGSETDDWD